MKVGTDGVLLGAWAPIDNCKRILDVGTGTGVIALQLAQRSPQAHIIAVEIDEAAANQACENVQNSPWPDRVQIVCADFRHYLSNERFDMIISNPPYFINSLKCPDGQRNTARHTDDLNYDFLFSHSVALLQPQGILAIVIPAKNEKTVMNAAGMCGFYIYRRMKLFTKPGKPSRRLLITFGFDPMHTHQEEILYITQEDGQYSEEYKALTQDFYLKL